MDVKRFRQLAYTDVDAAIAELDAAVESHAAWVADINRALILGASSAGIDLAPGAHERCTFGRWYRGLDAPVLGTLPQFAEIDAVHRAFHEAASRVMRDSPEQRQVAYDALIACSTRLRELIIDLRNELRSSADLFVKVTGKVFEGAKEGVMITDRLGRILSVNGAFVDLTGFTPEDVVGQNAERLYSGRHDNAFFQELWGRLHRDGKWQGEVWSRRKNGELFPEMLSVSAVDDDQHSDTYYVAIFSDISAEKAREQQLYNLAHFDELTQLPNRSLLYDRLQQAMADARRNKLQVGLLFIDLDGFKQVNDEHGHLAGDDLLRSVAARLRAMLREPDTLARFGGDEFAVVLPQLQSRSGAIKVAEKVLGQLGEPFELPVGTVSINGSLGISLFPVCADDLQGLIHSADEAMYKAKSLGKGQYRLAGCAHG